MKCAKSCVQLLGVISPAEVRSCWCALIAGRGGLRLSAGRKEGVRIQESALKARVQEPEQSRLPGLTLITYFISSYNPELQAVLLL